ncbi:MAG: NAD(P)-dependent oxidoreductase [Alphaproteobacteria bacterium]
MRVMVTGGAGFLGASLVRALAARGDGVVAFDQQPNPILDDLAGVEFVRGEILEWASVAATIQRYKPDAVVHCAAMVGVPVSIASPALTMRVNVEGSLNVLEAMRLFGVRRMLHISSEETYGHFQADRIDEGHPQHPIMAYGISKLAVEQLGRSYAQLHGLEVINIRTCWVYGPGLPRPRVPKTLVDAAAEGRPLHLPNGADFLVDHAYVDDVVAGLVQALDLADHPHDAYHMASGQAVTLADIVDVIKELVPAADLSVGPGTIDFAPGLPAWRKGALDHARAAEAFGYSPRFDIRAGLAATLAAKRANE